MVESTKMNWKRFRLFVYLFSFSTQYRMTHAYYTLGIDSVFESLQNVKNLSSNYFHRNVSETIPRYDEAGKLKVDVNGDVIFGGLFPMHEKGTQGRNCGEIKKEKGIQRLEAMMFAIDLINNDPNILPGLTVGMHILDTCSYDTFALEQCMDFIKAQLSTFEVNEKRCTVYRQPTDHRAKPVAGVIGAASSTVSIMVANILRLFKIPQISYASTSSDLSDKGRFEYFSRVVPPDNYQAQAMADIAKELKWEYVNTIAEVGTYGEKGIEAFKKAAKKIGVCLAESKIIPRNAENRHYDNIVNALLNGRNPANVGVMFASEDKSRKFITALKRLNRTDHLNLIASDSWGAKVHPVHGQEPAAVGTITLLVKRKDIKDFDDYFLNLNVTNNTRNPWFKEFWERNFNCSFSHINVKKKCTGREKLLAEGYKQEGLVQFVVNSVFSLAHAVHNILITHCQNGFPRCPYLRNLTGSRLLKYIRNVTFRGIGGEEFRFTKSGDGVGRYDIYQYQKTNDGGYKYKMVGEWTNELSINVSVLQWKNGSTGTPQTSICSKPCAVGESIRKTSQCCWVCAPCKDHEFLKDEETCSGCDELSKPSHNRTYCVRLPEVHLSIASLWFLVPASFSVLGVLSTVFVLLVIFRYNTTPVIMASGRELCYLLLLGIFLAYLTALMMLVRPTYFVCAFVRVGMGISLCFIYAGLLTKTNRIYRIFNVGIMGMVKRPSYTSPTSQILICGCLVSVQVLGGLAWLGFEKPATEYRIHSKDSMVKECRASQVATMASLLYNMLLIVLCTVYAFKTRNIPQNFNEAKYIAFTMYSTCIVWTAFIPIYFGANHDFKIEVTSLCMCVSISATTSLFCIFGPKIYIVIFQPHKNVRHAIVPTSTNILSSKTPKSLIGGSSSGNFSVQNGIDIRLHGQDSTTNQKTEACDPVDAVKKVLNPYNVGLEELSSSRTNVEQCGIIDPKSENTMQAVDCKCVHQNDDCSDVEHSTLQFNIRSNSTIIDEFISPCSPYFVDDKEIRNKDNLYRKPLSRSYICDEAESCEGKSALLVPERKKLFFASPFKTVEPSSKLDSYQTDEYYKNATNIPKSSLEDKLRNLNDSNRDINNDINDLYTTDSHIPLTSNKLVLPPLPQPIRQSKVTIGPGLLYTSDPNLYLHKHTILADDSPSYLARHRVTCFGSCDDKTISSLQ